MKNKKDETTTEVETLRKQLTDIHTELSSSEDFILSYIKTLAIVHGGSFNLEDLRGKYGWKMPKIMALQSAIKHFQARGLLGKGQTLNDVFIN
jgi:hypothetical protein